MIANANQLEVALRNLDTVEDALGALRAELLTTNPALFPVVSQAYLTRIRALQSDILAYLRTHPADAPLKVKIEGPAIVHGTVGASFVAGLLAALQSALYQVGKDFAAKPAESGRAKSLRALLGLNMVATQEGSFVLALDLAPRQLELFSDYDIAETAVVRLLEHIAVLSCPDAEVSLEKPMLRSLDKLASLVRPNKVASIDFDYQWEATHQRASLTLPVRSRIDSMLGRPKEGEELVRGTLISINIERNVCSLHPEGEPIIQCKYAEEVEDDLIPAVKKKVELSGIIQGDPSVGEPRRIKLIQRFRIVEDEDDDL